jgi:hypothetical protein
LLSVRVQSRSVVVFPRRLDHGVLEEPDENLDKFPGGAFAEFPAAADVVRRLFRVCRERVREGVTTMPSFFFVWIVPCSGDDGGARRRVSIAETAAADF